MESEERKEATPLTSIMPILIKGLVTFQLRV